MLVPVKELMKMPPVYLSVHWGRVTHICVGNLTIIGSDNGLSPGRRQAIIWTNAGILSFGPLGTNFSEILTEIKTFSFKKMYLKVSSAKWRPFCLGLNVLTVTLGFCRGTQISRHPSSSVVQSFWNFVQSTTVSLSCSVQKFKTIRQSRNNLWTNELSGDLCLRWILDRSPVLCSPRVSIIIC